MRSGRCGAFTQLLRTAIVMLFAGGVLAGCTTTQHEAQRVQLDAARGRAALLATKVTTANATVRATTVATVTADGRTAFVVSVVNSGRTAVSDLPISVGYAGKGGARVYLNDQPDLGYFDSHLPGLWPRHSRLWIYTSDRVVPSGARPFALIGPKPTVNARLTEPVSIAASIRNAGTSVVHVRLENSTSVPQYQLQVYVYAQSGGRYVAAGDKTVTDLGAGSGQRLTVPIIGDAGGARIQLAVAPTIQQ